MRLLFCRLWDTASSDEYSRLRPLSYPGTDVFVLVCSIGSKRSFDEAKFKWHKEISQHKQKNAKVLDF